MSDGATAREAHMHTQAPPRQAQGAGQSESEAQSQERKKGRSLSEMLNQQIEAGKEEALQMDARMDSSKRFIGGGRNRSNGQRQYGRGGMRQQYNGNYGNYGGYQNYDSYNDRRQPAPSYVPDPSLNWQQQSLMAEDAGYNSRQPPRRDYSSHSQGYPPPQQQQRYNGRQPYQYQQQQQRYNGYRGQQQGYAGGAQPPVKKSGRELPEWADDLAHDHGAGVQGAAASSLNWQQQALVNRDETDPFLSLVRGEHDLSRE